MSDYYQELFTQAEIDVLSRFFTNTDRPVFGLINLPEVVKGALFARYSRTHKSVRRLFLDEFVEKPELGIEVIAGALGRKDGVVKLGKAEDLYDRIFLEYGDDSVAQLGGVHLACEQASNVLTKVLEWGRIAAYLEQSTRYIAYDRPLGDRYRYFVPEEVRAAGLEQDFTAYMERIFTFYSTAVERLVDHFSALHPQQEGDSDFVWRSTIRAKAYDTVRGVLPAATQSNVGIYGTGQAYEMALVRMQAHPLTEVRSYGAMMLEELRKQIPAFMKRVDLQDRGGMWSEYLARTAGAVAGIAAELEEEPEAREEVTLVDWDPEAELKVAAAALYASSEMPDSQLLKMVGLLSADERRRILTAYFGDRRNRRHKPGRAMERVYYRFDVLSDYGAFRDLQRHRMLTIEWQRLTTRFGYDTPEEVAGVGLLEEWEGIMEEAGVLYERVRAATNADVAQYVVPFAYRIRYMLEMNAREAFHLLELRTQPAGHPSYRRVCQEMHRQIREVAGHRVIADAMQFVDHSDPGLERLDEERRLEAKRRSAGTL
ncbi:MAG TPA: FAD-dependent thymidylate synthase [Acidimicrobiia bacterium]|nr:FAD-dependent thymidylate synthase [Acidimicrobiia bacterium]